MWLRYGEISQFIIISSPLAGVLSLAINVSAFSVSLSTPMCMYRLISPPPYRIDTPRPIANNIAQMFTSATTTSVPNPMQIRPRGGGVALRRLIGWFVGV